MYVATNKNYNARISFSIHRVEKDKQIQSWHAQPSSSYFDEYNTHMCIYAYYVCENYTFIRHYKQTFRSKLTHTSKRLSYTYTPYTYTHIYIVSRHLDFRCNF